ncbi:CPBP family intramembrane glutamic endopeptidase [Naasia sp. SYSU D00948]|uniref:CPBP family intramembrane glutamic endopeptidase n=1 Tax=Naasia sp. SYSU D00948 TaxID=2817379 RepID=UPI001B30CD23|nr:CPBP family intramembrane glutamic endopeptidase [Naasia sp. SYSU D00948]
MATLTATPPASTGTRRGRVLAWTLILSGSALPLILWREWTGGETFWPALVQVLVLGAGTLAAPRVPRLRPLAPVLAWMLAIAAGWHLVFAVLHGLPAWDAWQHSVPWVARGTVVQALVFIPTLLLIGLGVGRRSRSDLRLTWHGGAAPAAPDLISLGRRTRWSVLGPVWAVLISIGTLTAMLIALPPGPDALATLLPALPMVMILAATNTFNEEFQFRNVPLAFLPGLYSRMPALLMTAAVFGLEHFYGNPPGASGVVLAAFLGYVMAKSVVETNSSRWVWLIHWLQDVIIFSFLAMSWN